MRTFVAILTWEAKLQALSLRSRVAAAGYVTLCAVPPATVLYLSRLHPFSQATYLQHLSAVQPFLTVVMVALVAGSRSSIDEQPRTVSVLGSASVSDAGYLLRRSAAVTLLTLAWSVVPLAVAAGLAVAGKARPVLETWSWTWAIDVAPVVVVASALWLGTVTILGSELAALGLLTIGIASLVEALNAAVLRHFQMRIEGIFDWAGFHAFGSWIAMWQFLIRPERLEFLPNLTGTEAPYDPWGGLLELWPRLVLPLGLAVLALGLGAGYVRRTRRDLKPHPVRSDHPARGFLERFNRMRQRLAPGGGLAPGDRLVMAAGVVLLLGAFAAFVARYERYQRIAEERYAVEMEDPIPPTSRDLVPASWRIRGSLTLDGRVETEVTARMTNRGEEPADRLAFSLDEKLALLGTEVTGRRFESRRLWDRLELRLEPPLGPGEGLELRFRLAGTPGEVDFPLWGRHNYSFATCMKSFLAGRFARDFSDLSRSVLRRAASRRRVALMASHLAPVPRYTSFTLTPYQSISGSGREVPPERFHRDVDLEVDLAVPGSFFLADVCAHTSVFEGTAGRLRGRCRTELARYAVEGGQLTPLRSGQAVVAVLDVHRQAAGSLSEALAETARLSDRAWPGLPGLDSVVVLEELPASEEGPGLRRFYAYGDPGFALHGRLLTISEVAFASDQMPEPSKLVASVLGRDLMARRLFADHDRHLYQRFFAALMLRRMGLSKRDARVSGPPWLKSSLKTPILEARDTPWSNPLNVRLPAVVAALEGRIGSPRLFDALEAFLAVPSEQGARFKDLFTFLEERTGVALGRFFDDFVAGGALPELELDDVHVEDRGTFFEVRGRVRNTGTGEVVCPVLVKAEVGAGSALVTVGSESEATFAIRTAMRPNVAVLDPEGTCHRLVGPNSAAAESVDLLE